MVDSHRQHESSATRRRMFTVLFGLYATLIFAAPVVAAGIVFSAALERAGVPLAVLLAGAGLVVSLPLVAGTLSLFHQRWIVPGRWPTDVGVRVYFHRRLYGLCWTSLYYMQPIYLIVLTFPWLRRLVFGLFGYRGSHRFTVYPDTWIRDLPLLHLEEGAYLSNKATIGTNMRLPTHEIQVDHVRVGMDAMVGHLACVAPGARLGARATVGTAALVGIGAQLGDDAVVDHGATMDHYSCAESGARVGHGCRVGAGAVVERGASMAAGQVLPARARMRADRTVIRGRSSALDGVPESK